MFSFDRNVFHLGLLRSSLDRAGVSRIGLVTQDKGAHRFGGQQTNLLPQLRKLACPPMRTATRFHGNQGQVQACLNRLTLIRFIVFFWEVLGQIHAVMQ